MTVQLRYKPLIYLMLVTPWTVGFGPYRPAGMGSAALGMGDAVTAAGTGVQALYANPAAMAQIPQHTIEVGFSRNGQAGADSVYAATVDATSGWGLTGGVGVAHDVNWTLDAGRREATDLRGGLAVGVNNDSGRLMLGASSRYLSIDTHAPLTKRHVAGWTGDLGIDVALNGLRLGAVLRNGLKLDAAEAPRRVALGVGYVNEHVLVEADGSWGVRNDTSALPQGVAAMTGQAYRLGGSYQFGQEGAQVRAGYVFDQTELAAATRHMVSAGLGWHTITVAIDLSMAINVARPSEFLIAAGLTFVVPYDVQ